MALKLSSFIRNVSRVSKSSAASMSSGHHHHKSPVETAQEHRMTLNDLPVPGGSWQEYHNKINGKWNILLGASVVSLLATIFMMKEAKLFYFHSCPDLKSVKLNIK